MKLRALAGAYAGQVLDYGVVAGLAALRTGMAERLDDVYASAPQTAPVSAGPSIAASDSDKTRPGPRRTRK